MQLETRTRSLATLLLACALAACGGGDTVPGGEGGGDEEVVPISLSGSIVDFQTGDTLESGTVTVDGISPPPTVSVTGADFLVEGIPPFSTFHLLASSPPGYRSTYSVAIESADSDVDGVVIETLSEDYVADLHSVFGVEESTSTSVVVARLIDDEGRPVSGVPASAFAIDAASDGPYFLDAEKAPDAALEESSESGYVVVFHVNPGVVRFEAAPGANLSMVMADSPTAARAVTLADIKATPALEHLALLRQSRLSVVPIDEAAWQLICRMGEVEAG